MAGFMRGKPAYRARLRSGLEGIEPWAGEGGRQHVLERTRSPRPGRAARAVRWCAAFEFRRGQHRRRSDPGPGLSAAAPPMDSGCSRSRSVATTRAQPRLSRRPEGTHSASRRLEHADGRGGPPAGSLARHGESARPGRAESGIGERALGGSGGHLHVCERRRQRGLGREHGRPVSR